MRLVPLLAASAVGAAVVRDQQIPLVEHSSGQAGSGGPLTVEEGIDQPSIGVHFTSSNAVAAARYSNGTTLDLAKVEGDADYIDLMSRWMGIHPESTREATRLPCKTKDGKYVTGEPCTWNGLHEKQAHLHNSVTHDVATLSRFLTRVRTLVETDIGMRMTTLAPVFSSLDNAQTEKVQDAMEAVGLKSTHADVFTRGDVIDDTTAAYAGTGELLCRNWMNLKRCRLERSAMHDKTVLFLGFHDHSFSASVYNIRNDGTFHAVGPRVNSAELGWWDLPVFETPRAKFWAKTQEAIQSVVGGLGRETISKIVLMGEHGTNREFKDIVEAAIWSALGIDVGPLLQGKTGQGAERIAARGAAEMAWRQEFWTRKADLFKANR